MMTKYFMTQPYLEPVVAAAAQNVDRTPTLHYYGTLELSETLLPEDAEAAGLVLADDVTVDFEYDSLKLYRAEMGGRA